MKKEFKEQEKLNIELMNEHAMKSKSQDDEMCEILNIEIIYIEAIIQY